MEIEEIKKAIAEGKIKIWEILPEFDEFKDISLFRIIPNEEGIGKVDESRLWILSSKFMGEMISNFTRTIGKVVGGILYRTSFKVAFEFFNKLKERFNEKELNLLNIITKLWMMVGIGKVNVVVENDVPAIIVHNSVEGEGLGKTGVPSCNIIRGMAAAAFSVAYEKECSAKEVMCICKGDEYCKFVLTEAEWFERLHDVIASI